jgi:hypothetical protein
MAKARKSVLTRHGRLALSGEQIETLMEIGTLVYYSDGFT